MSELTFHVVDDSGLREYQTWFQDAELRRRIEPPTMLWFNYVTQTPGCYAWMVYQGNLALGQLQLNTYPNNTGSVGLVVNPKLRNQGYGKRILQAFLKRPEVMRLNQLEVTIEPDNLASIRCFQKVGFVQASSEPDQEGFLHFTYHSTSSNRPA
jgi:RimJ/RimL family protein N-acetyltransferase